MHHRGSLRPHRLCPAQTLDSAGPRRVFARAKSSAEIRVVPLLDGRKGVHVDVDDLALAGQAHFGLRMFGPPCGPSDLVRGARGLHDALLIGGIEWLRETDQRGLDEPRFQDDPRGRAVRIEYLGHSQRLQCRRDAPGSYTFPDDVQGTDHTLLPVSGLVNYGEGCTGCGAVAFDPAFRELEQKRLRRRNTARGPALADSNHPT
jgi:hypothetical protein